MDKPTIFMIFMYLLSKRVIFSSYHLTFQGKYIQPDFEAAKWPEFTCHWSKDIHEVITCLLVVESLCFFKGNRVRVGFVVFFSGGIFCGMLSFFLGGFSEICLFLCKEMNRPPLRDVFFSKNPGENEWRFVIKIAVEQTQRSKKVVFRFFTNPPPSN